MERPRRNRKLPNRYGRDKSPSITVEELDSIDEEQEQTIERMEEQGQSQSNSENAVMQNREGQHKSIPQNIKRRKLNVIEKQNDNVEPMFRVLRRSLGTLMMKVNSLSEEVKVTKETIENGNKPKPVEVTVEETIQDQTIQQEEELTEKEYKKVVYNVRNISVEKPKFGDKEIHPVTFLEDLEIYLRKATKEGKELDLIQECLVGDARDWARVYRERWIGIEDFKKDFLATYWGDREQNELRRTIVQGSWDRTKGVSMMNHFLKLTGRAKMLSFNLPEKQLVADIIRHYPKYIQQGWLTSKLNSIIETAEYLRNLDDLNKQETHMFSTTGASKEKERKKEQQQNYQNWPKPRMGYQSNNKTQATANQVEVIEERKKQYQRNYGNWQKSNENYTVNNNAQSTEGQDEIQENATGTWIN